LAAKTVVCSVAKRADLTAALRVWMTAATKAAATVGSSAVSRADKWDSKLVAQRAANWAASWADTKAGRMVVKRAALRVAN
jgi:hypothetical protein